MEISSIELPGSEVESIGFEGEDLILRFSRAYIIKILSGTAERTKWWQAGDLVFEQAEVDGDLPKCPAVCSGGDFAVILGFAFGLVAKEAFHGL